MKNAGIISTIIVVFGVTAAVSHSGATGLVKERMVAMSTMGKDIKTIAPMMSGEAAYDAEKVRRAAASIGTHAGDAMTRLFPANNENKASYVKDAIWTDWAEFAMLAEQLGSYADGLGLAAENGLADPNGDVADTSAMMGSTAMMGGGTDMAETMDAEDFEEMAADDVFAMISDTCSDCHTRFRSETK